MIGAGAIAQLAHLPVLAKTRGAEAAAIFDNDRPKARAFADRFGIPDVITDIEGLLEIEDLDAVVVATPNNLHEPRVLSPLASSDMCCPRAHFPRARAASSAFSRPRRGPIELSPLRTTIGIESTCRPLSQFIQGANSTGSPRFVAARSNANVPPKAGGAGVGRREGERSSIVPCRCSIWPSGSPTIRILSE